MISYFILKIIKGYQLLVSPFLGEHCRFYPSCSEYAASAVQKYGWPAGLRKSAKRLLKCHPLNPGGVDLP